MEFGFRPPIVVDQHGVIVVGHTRWKAAKKLGRTEVPVHVAQDLSPEQAKAYRLADNATNELAVWDKELLPLELSDLKAADFDLGLLGFSPDVVATLPWRSSARPPMRRSPGRCSCGTRRTG